MSPVERAYRRWDREVTKTRTFLEQIPKLEDIRGRRWVEKMQAYYTKHLQVLLANEPPKR